MSVTAQAHSTSCSHQRGFAEVACTSPAAKRSGWTTMDATATTVAGTAAASGLHLSERQKGNVSCGRPQKNSTVVRQIVRCCQVRSGRRGSLFVHLSSPHEPTAEPRGKRMTQFVQVAVNHRAARPHNTVLVPDTGAGFGRSGDCHRSHPSAVGNAKTAITKYSMTRKQPPTSDKRHDMFFCSCSKAAP